jgi:hypothetical protein
MKFDNLPQNRSKATRSLVARNQRPHDQMSRRRFIATTAGASVLGAGLLRPMTALAGPGIGNLIPTPNTLNAFGVPIHVQVPNPGNPNVDPVTIWNFQGYSGIALINTTATQTNRKTGVVQENLTSSGNHMVFMKGVYRGRDGHVRDGTFGFV